MMSEALRQDNKRLLILLDKAVKEAEFYKKQLISVTKAQTDPPVDVRPIDYKDRYLRGAIKLKRFKKIFGKLYWYKD